MGIGTAGELLHTKLLNRPDKMSIFLRSFTPPKRSIKIHHTLMAANALNHS